jgi:hypothetical protein
MWELPSTALLLWAMAPYVGLRPFTLEDLEVRFACGDSVQGV